RLHISRIEPDGAGVRAFRLFGPAGHAERQSPVLMGRRFRRLDADRLVECRESGAVPVEPQQANADRIEKPWILRCKYACVLERSECVFIASLALEQKRARNEQDGMVETFG